MKSSLFKIMAIAVLALGLCGGTPVRAASNAAIIGGIIAGAAVGAVVASSIRHPKRIYYPGPPGPPPWQQVITPSPGITCYAAQQACYSPGGGYSAKWTYRVFGS